ncbi:ATP-binding protein, partial [Ideonella sp.]|uniref:ATP-binding protein n=1 Tax=Ideonella sp. TaxID=1929293 RepID=UPI002B470412
MPQSTQSTPTIAVRFAQFELRPAQRLLLVGGEPVDIGSRAFDLLLAFIERPGELLRKAELMERVWPRVVVEENNLQVQVSTLRRVLGSRAIVTIPGHGYRFTLPLSADDGSSAGAGATVAPPSAVAPGGLALLGGRRSVVLLKLGFANAVTPSTPIADEDWHEFLGAFEGCAKEVLARHGGLLTECDMLGVTALFGLPAAGENDLTQAVEAGLEMITGVRARRWAGLPPGLALRGGLAHASVIAAPGAAPGTWRLSGSLSVTALALCDAAQAHELLVSQETRRQIVPYFDTAPHAPVEHSVLPHALEAHGVLGRSGIVTRIEAARWRGFTPLVGRAEELRVLTMAFNDMLAGKGRAISLVAEAGVGKSRLVAEFGRRLPPEQARVLHARCQPQLQMSAYAPFVDLLRTLLQLKNPAPEWLEADLSQSLQAIDPALKGWTPVVRKLLSAGPMASDAADGLNADVSRRQLSEAVVALISAAARIEPLVLVLDDWHWSDQASDDVLKMLVAMGAHLRVLLIVTARPQAQLAWPTSAHCEQLLLRPLAPAQSADMVRGIFGAQSIATSIASAIHERTEGNPFFIEEICRALLDQGTLTLSDGLLHSKRTIEGIALPHSIEALIRALLDQLPEAAQDLAKLASVLGRDFSRDDLEALSVHAGASGELLARLVDAALIEPTQLVPGPRYRFRHALVQFV